MEEKKTFKSDVQIGHDYAVAEHVMLYLLTVLRNAGSRDNQNDVLRERNPFIDDDMNSMFDCIDKRIRRLVSENESLKGINEQLKSINSELNKKLGNK